MSVTKQSESGQTELEDSQLKVSRRLHPEDIAIGDDVAVSEIAYQYASFMWFGVDSSILPPHETVQLTFFPSGDHEPLTVKSVCLPFVLCERAEAQHLVIDLRQTQLVRLDKSFANSVRAALKSNDSIKKKSKRKKGRK